MTKHPLTDKTLEQFGTPADQGYADMGRLFFDDDMRAAYDLAIDRCVEWIDNYDPHNYDVIARADTIQAFKEAMRPTQEND